MLHQYRYNSLQRIWRHRHKSTYNEGGEAYTRWVGDGGVGSGPVPSSIELANNEGFTNCGGSHTLSWRGCPFRCIGLVIGSLLAHASRVSVMGPFFIGRTSVIRRIVYCMPILMVASVAHAAVILIAPADFGPAAVRLNFDELQSPTILDNVYASRGVVFSNALASAGPFPVSPPIEVGAINGSNPVIISFPTGALKVGIQIDTDGYSPDRQPQIRAYDAQGNLLATQLFGQGPDFEGFAAIDGSIDHVALGSCRTFGDSTCRTLAFSDAYDNLVFELLSPNDAAPEPSTAAIALLGAFVLMIAYPRRLAKARTKTSG